MRKTRKNRPKWIRLRDRAWILCSEYIRKRDKGICFTCGEPGDQAGHFKHGKNCERYFDEYNIHCQCLTEESNLRMFNGEYKSIKDVSVGDELWGFNDRTFEREMCVVDSVESFIPKELYEITTENGKRFYATKDHKVVANNNWVEVKDLIVGVHDIMEL